MRPCQNKKEGDRGGRGGAGGGGGGEIIKTNGFYLAF
jgi:hypothetical protein